MKYLIFLFTLFYLFSCAENDLKLLKNIPINENESLKIYYYNGHATADYTIQLFKFKNDEKIRIKTFVDYDSLLAYQLHQNDSISLFLIDKVLCEDGKCKIDTFKVKY